MVWTREREGSSNKKALLNQEHENITLFDAHNVQVSQRGLQTHAQMMLRSWRERSCMPLDLRDI